MSVRFLATRAAFPVLLVGGLALAVAACGDDDPVYYPDAGGVGGADTTGGSDATGGSGQCASIIGSCTVDDGAGTVTCSDFSGSAQQGGGFQQACEQDGNGSFSTSSCTAVNPQLNAGCEYVQGPICTTAWTEVEAEDMESFRTGCDMGGGTTR